MLNFQRTMRDRYNGTVRKGNCRACQIRVLSHECYHDYGKHCNQMSDMKKEDRLSESESGNGTSVVVQRLRLQISNAGSHGLKPCDYSKLNTNKQHNQNFQHSWKLRTQDLVSESLVFESNSITYWLCEFWQIT